VTGLSDVVQIAVGAASGFALARGGATVMAWGDNSSGQLGTGTTTGSDVPVAVTGLTGVRYIAAGGSHAVALLQSGGVRSWGDNTNGQLGLGSTTGADVPTAVPNLAGVRGIAAGADFTLARAKIRPATLAARGTATTRAKTAFTKVIHVRSLPNVSSIAVSGKLPTGVTFVNNGDNTASLTGTPTTGTSGQYPLTVTATNGIGPVAQESLSLVVKP
jgi:hypothetical protein